MAPRNRRRAYFKSLADKIAISDNYHQAIMGGTGPFPGVVSGHAAFFTNPTTRRRAARALPIRSKIRSGRGTNNYYTQDGYSGGSYVNCPDLGAAGRGRGGPATPRNGGRATTARRDNIISSTTKTCTGTRRRIRPLGPPLHPAAAEHSTIADELTAQGVSWKYYTGDRCGDDRFPASVDGVALALPLLLRHLRSADRLSEDMKNPSECAKLAEQRRVPQPRDRTARCRRCRSCARSRPSPDTPQFAHGPLTRSSF